MLFLTETVVTSADWQSVITALTNQISVSTVVSVLASVAGGCVGLSFMWWGLRKGVDSLMCAFRSGKVSL